MAEEERQVKERLRELRREVVDPDEGADPEAEPLLTETDAGDVLGVEVESGEVQLSVPAGFVISTMPPSEEALQFAKPASEVCMHCRRRRRCRSRCCRSQ